MKMKIINPICLSIVVLSLFWAASAWAISPVILDAAAGEFDPGTGVVDAIEINGQNLHDGVTAPVVTLGDVQLDIKKSNNIIEREHKVA